MSIMLLSEALAFLQELQSNNNTDWFRAQKSRYEAYKIIYHQTITSLLDAMMQVDPNLQGLEAKHCTFRINRDIRFSKDKSPYKTHMGIWMAQNRLQRNSPGYYVHLEPGAAFVAGGLWCPEPHDVQKIRREIAFFYEDLMAVMLSPQFQQCFGDFSREKGQFLQKIPKDYTTDHPAGAWLTLKSFTVSSPISLQDIDSKVFIEQITAKLRLLKPLNDFLSRGLHTED